MAEFTRRHLVWHNKPTLDTPADAQAWQGVEDALDKLLGKDTPAVDEVGVWTPGSGGLIWQKIGANQLADNAVTNAKLADGAVKNAEVAADAAIAYEKLVLEGKVDLASDVDVATALAIERLAGYPNDASKSLLGNGTWGSSGPAPALTLPSSPTDSMRALLTDSLTAPTYVWEFQYEAGISDADKWIFVGGSSAISLVATPQTTASTSFADLATTGPSFTIPRAGVYEFQFEAEMANSGSSSTILGLIGAAELARTTLNLGTTGTSRSARTIQVSGLTASQVVKLQYAVGSGTGTFTNRVLVVRPVRVA